MIKPRLPSIKALLSLIIIPECNASEVKYTIAGLFGTVMFGMKERQRMQQFTRRLEGSFGLIACEACLRACRQEWLPL
jgi:hypothetical protein